jgi:hypothetical protein
LSSLKLILKNIYKTLLAGVFALIVLALVLVYIPRELAIELVDEYGPVETAQVILYLLAATFCFGYKIRNMWDRGLIAGLILVVFALRELDFQVKFTDISVTRTKFYFAPDVPLETKIIAGIIVLSIIWLINSFAWKNFRRLIDGVKDNKIWSVLAMNGIIFVFLAIEIDMSLRGFEVNKEREIIKSFFEEMSELAIPIYFLAASITYGISFSRSRKEL